MLVVRNDSVTVSVLWVFLAVPLVGLQCVIVAFPDHTHSLFLRIDIIFLNSNEKKNIRYEKNK